MSLSRISTISHAERVQQVDQAGDGEDPGDDPDDGALEQLRDLLADLGLGELDLLADEELRLLGDVLDRLAQLG